MAQHEELRAESRVFAEMFGERSGGMCGCECSDDQKYALSRSFISATTNQSSDATVKILGRT